MSTKEHSSVKTKKKCISICTIKKRSKNKWWKTRVVK